MAGIAFAAQNVSLGLVYGLFGTVVGALEQRIQLNRAQSSLGLGIMLLTLGICSPFAGAILGGRPVRGAIALALLVESVALVGLAYADSYFEYLAAFVLLGCSLCVAGVICPFLLINRWFPQKRAFALAVMNSPVLLALAPLVAGMVEPRLGARFILWAAAGFCLMVAAAALAIVRDPPVRLPAGDTAAPEPAFGKINLNSRNDPASDSSRSFIRNRRFWFLALGVGILNGAGATFLGHIVPFATERLIPLQSASKIVFAFGAAGIAGALACGWFADRIGAVKELMLIALFSAAIWTGFLFIYSLDVILVLAALFGSFTTSLAALSGAAIGELFRPEEAGKIAGASLFVQVPLIFGLTPAVGMLHDVSGNYIRGFEFIIFTYAIAFFLLAFAIGIRKPSFAA
jgi:MFS family permease